jgi:hypothetical protein
MHLAQDFRRQARVCARLADDCDDPRLADRLRAMASDLLAKAEELKDAKPVRHLTTMRSLAETSRRALSTNASINTKR